MMKRRWRVIQTSDTFGHVENFRDYRFHWYARFIAFMFKGQSVGLGLHYYRTRIEKVVD